MKFWQWLGLVILLAIVGGILIRLTYIIKTGHDRLLDAQAPGGGSDAPIDEQISDEEE